jgi:hypothetical protein
MTPDHTPQINRQPTRRWITPLLLAGSAFFVLLQAPTVHAQSFVDSNAALYRCAVLGETRSCQQQQLGPSEWKEEWVELGTQAKYFRYLGAEPAEAIAQARALGEEPIRHVDRVVRVQLTPQQQYERGTGQRVLPSEKRESLLVGPAREAQPDLYTKLDRRVR